MNPSMMGGVLLWERNGLISAICNDCWINYSNQRIIKTEAQRKAFKHNIGVECQLFHRDMVLDRSFQENLEDARLKLKINSFQVNPLLLKIRSSKGVLVNVSQENTTLQVS